MPSNLHPTATSTKGKNPTGQASRLALLFAVSLACRLIVPQPTPTASPSDTPSPTSTQPPAPTNTSMPTDTPTLSASNNSTGECVISIDHTYGYTQENPIKVGGGDFDGPPRERAFLDNLLGPNGERVSYERTGSFSFEDTILDIFDITGLSKQVTLYVDEYSYSEPQAPVGFTCLSVFPLSQP